MTRSTKRNVVLGMVMLLMTAAACGDDAGADPARFCEINTEIDRLGDPFELPPDEARDMVQTGRDLLDESIKVAPDEIRSSVEIEVASFDPFFDLFEAAGFDVTQIDDAEIEAMFETVFSGENEAAFDVVEAWVDANCST